MRPLLRKVCADNEVDLETRFLKLKKNTVVKRFGLDTYCKAYGKMSSTFLLNNEAKPFDDWHLHVPFEGEHVNSALSCRCYMW